MSLNKFGMTIRMTFVLLDPSLIKYLEMKLKKKANKEKKTACCVTLDICSQGEMIKLVKSPDGRLCFDFKQNLPGPSFFVKNSKSVLMNFLQNNYIDSKPFFIKEESEALLYKIEDIYIQKMLSIISLAKKSGNLILGKEKIKNSLKNSSNTINTIIQSKDASMREKFIPMDSVVEIYEIFNSCQLSKACGKEGIVYMLITKEFAELFKKFYNKYHCYLRG